MSTQAPLSERSAAWKALKPWTFAAISTCSATCTVQPIDMVKVRIQLQGKGGGSTNPLSVALNLLKNEGPLTFYRGLSAGLTRQMTYGMSRMGIYRVMSDKFTPKDGSAMPFMTRVGCSLVAGGTGALIGTPADAALVRMQADTILPPDQRRGYKNALDALLRMAREEGVRGFFSGAAPTVYRGLAVNIGMLSTYDYFKDALQPVVGDGKANKFGAGALSGWCASTLSLPFDFVKTRLQRQKADANGVMPYKNFFDCVRKVAAEEGVGAFYKGYATYVVRITPHIMITWIFLEVLNDIEMLK